MKTDAEIEQQILRNRDDPRGTEFICRVGAKILNGHSQQAPAEFTELVRRALLELDQRKIARLEDDHSKPFFDPQFDGRSPNATFAEVAGQWLAIVEQEGTANGVNKKWIDKQRAIVVLLRELVGSMPVRKVDYDVCMMVRSKIAKVPANRLKTYPKLSIDDAIAQAEKDGKRLLAVPTQGDYLAAFRGILDLAVKKRSIGTNPATGIGTIKKDTVAKKDKRLPFKPEQLQGFFGGKFYSGCATASPAWKADARGWRFWLPLMCLLMGMRPNEVCQMMAGDVKRTAKGTWYCDVVAGDDDGKTLKTETSRRCIPLHPTLIAIGFLQFVEARAGGRLFPDLVPNKYGNFAWYALKQFRESFFPAEITVEPRQTFYSFRHNFRDELRRTKAPNDALQALAGWSQGHLVSDDYGDKANPDYMIEFVEKVIYPGLDLSHLYAGA